MSRRVTVRALIIRDTKIFGVRHIRPDGYTRDFWCTPGGGLDEGESLVDGVRREIREETGVEAVVDRLLAVQQFSKPTESNVPATECLEFFFLVKDSEAFDRIDLKSTTHGQAEIKETGFIDPSAVDFLPKFLQTVDRDELLARKDPLIVNNLYPGDSSL